MPFPNFHSAALCIKLGFGIFYESPMVSPPNGPLTVDVVTAFHEHANVEASFLPPSILRDMLKDTSAVDSLKRLKYVGYGALP